MTTETVCRWCGRAFAIGRRGGRTRVFCSTTCKTALHTAARRWAESELAAGRVTVADLKGACVNVHVGSTGGKQGTSLTVVLRRESSSFAHLIDFWVPSRV